MLTSATRLLSLFALLVALVVAAGCGGDDGGGGGGGGSAADGEGGGGGERATVTLGTVAGSSADAAVFIAIEKGFFEEQNLEVKLERFQSGARMVAPLGAGQLDAASGGVSAGLFNAIARGLELQIVADKARAVPPGFASLLVRKELVDSGEYQNFSDLRGKTVALPARGVVTGPMLNAFLDEAGLSFDDVRIEQVGFADQIPALASSAVDAAIAIEPSATKAVQSGAAERVARTAEYLPGQQTSAILYSTRFGKENRDAAQRFMVAYLEGVRYYNDALVDGRLQGPNAKEIAGILTKHTAIEDPAFYQEIALHGVDPNGENNVASIKAQMEFWNDQGLLEGIADDEINQVVEQGIDDSFREAAIQELGPYEEPEGQGPAE